MVFLLGFWWSISLENEDFTQVSFACNGGDFKGFCMPLSHGYKAGRNVVVWLIVICSLPLCFFVVGIRNEG